MSAIDPYCESPPERTDGESVWKVDGITIVVPYSFDSLFHGNPRHVTLLGVSVSVPDDFARAKFEADSGCLEPFWEIVIEGDDPLITSQEPLGHALFDDEQILGLTPRHGVERLGDTIRKAITDAAMCDMHRTNRVIPGWVTHHGLPE